MLRFASTGRSHPGLVREHNEDAGFAGPYLQLVADGVGGAAAGEVASATAAYVVSALACGRREDEPLELLERAVGLVHEQLRTGTERDPSRAGMGTTLTALLLAGERCAVAHVGDSRAYLLRGGELSRITHDQTYVQTLVDAQVITPDDARSHPRKNVVLQALDASAPAEPDLTLLQLQVADRLLLCSDGLTDLLRDETIAECLADTDPEAVADRLVELALAAGGVDNVTCLVADVEDGPRLVPDGQRLGALADPHLVVDPAAVRSDGGPLVAPAG